MRKCNLAMCVGLIFGATVYAQDNAPGYLKKEVQELKGLVQQLRETVEKQQKRIEELERNKPPAAPVATQPAQPKLEEQLAKELAAQPTPIPKPWPPSSPVTLWKSAAGQSYVNLSMDLLATAGTSTARDVEALQRGDHDPHQRGFTIQNAELVLDGAVDPYFRGQTNIVTKIDSGGETAIELEEAYLTSTSLPWNLQVKAGQYFTEFGRNNPQHPHAWDFVDMPLVNSRVFGPDGLRNPGVQVSWLFPTPFYAEAFLSVQDSQGGTAFSFRNSAESTLFGRTPLSLEDRPVRNFDDLLFVPRLVTSFDLTDTQTVVLGTSVAFGPNNSGSDTRTEIFGGDIFWKWKPTNAHGGFPFLKWQTEAMWRRFEAGADPTVPLSSDTLHDWGVYSQLVWGFRKGWALGLRGDYVGGDASPFEGEPSQRWRISPALTWYPSEFSKLRLQYNYDSLEHMASEHSVWLQFEFLLGAHAAHKF